MVVDLKYAKQPSQVYVMLSRAQTLSQIYIIDKLFEDNWRVSESAVRELQSSETNAVNVENYEDKLMILSLNTSSLRQHFDDVLRLQQQRKFRILCLQETWLHTTTDPAEYKIDGLQLFLNSVGLGKGLATYCESDFILDQNVTNPLCQISKITSEKIDVINAYRSDGSREFLDELAAIIDENKPTIVCGDTNIDVLTNEGRELEKLMNDLRFTQLVCKPTHMRGGLIDQVFVSNHLRHQVTVKQEACRHSDHDILTIIVDI